MSSIRWLTKDRLVYVASALWLATGTLVNEPCSIIAPLALEENANTRSGSPQVTDRHPPHASAWQDWQLPWGVSTMSRGQVEEHEAPGPLTRKTDSWSLRHGAGLEWSQQLGQVIRHGWNLDSKPLARGEGPLSLELTIDEPNVHLSSPDSGRSVSISHPDAGSLRFGTITAIDSRQQEMETNLSIHENTVIVTVDDSSAIYPLVIASVLRPERLGDYPGERSPSVDPAFMTSLNGETIFPMDGFLWKTDGTPTGTTPYVRLEGFGSRTFGGVIFKNELYFAFEESSSSHLWSLWKTDGTAEGTKEIASLDGLEPSEWAIAGDVLYFSTSSSLWRTAGSNENTLLLANVDSFQLTPVGDRLFFAGEHSTGPNARGGHEPWVTDGTIEGTRQVIDIYPNPPGTVFPTGSLDRTQGLVSFDGLLLFHGHDGQRSFLATTNGERDGSFYLLDTHGEIVTNATNLIALGDSAYFRKNRLWWRLSRDQDTGLLETTAVEGSDLFTVSQVLTSSDTIYFESGGELWSINEDGASAVSIGDIPREFGRSGQPWLANEIYVVTAGDKSWYLDTTGNFQQLRIAAYTQDTDLLRGLGVQLGDQLLFMGSHERSRGLYAHSLLTNETVLLTNSGNEPKLTSENLVIDEQGSAYFSGYDYFHGHELWVMHKGQEACLLKDIRSDFTSSSPFGFMAIEGKVFFTAVDTEGIRRELWMTDGTDAGTTLAANFEPNRTQFLPVDDKLYMLETIWIENKPRWKLSQINSTGQIVDVGNYDAGTGINPLLFSAENRQFIFGSYRSNYWISDGTAEGTHEAVLPNFSDFSSRINVSTTHIVYQSQISNQFALAAVGIDDSQYQELFPSRMNSLMSSGSSTYFVPESANGQLWVTDGSTSGTVMLQEVEERLSIIEIIQSNSHDLLVVKVFETDTSWQLWSADRATGSLTIEHTFTPATVRSHARE